MTASSPEADDRELGIVYTPPAIAAAIVGEVLGMATQPVTAILEPSAGEGAFLAPLEVTGLLARVTALDIDPRAVAQLRSQFGEAKIVEGDFLRHVTASAGRFDVILGNPPYIRRKAFGEALKAEIARLAELQQHPLPQLKNAWAAFVVGAERLLSDTGVMAFVVPYELVNVDYGIALQRWLLTRFARLDIYIPDEKAFKAIDQDAVLMIARRTSNEPGAFVRRVTNLETLASTACAVDLSTPDAVNINLNSFLLSAPVIERVRAIVTPAKRVSDYCRSGAGIVTAANDYFILSDKDVAAHGLECWARPILKKGSYLGRGPIFSADDFARVSERWPAKLIDLNDYDEAEPDAAVQAYLKLGHEANIPKSYKASHRPIWFKVPVTWRGQGFFFKRSHGYPRLCINEANVLVTDTAYSLAPLGEATMRGICFSFYNSVTLLMSEIEGRFYGGGVLELTPNEFRRLPLFYSEPTDAQFAAFCEVQQWRDPLALAIAGDKVLAERHGFTAQDLTDIHAAWKVLRAHRLRHGRAD